MNVNTTAYFTTFAETVAWAGQTYAPIPMAISTEQQQASGELPAMYVDVANYGGAAFKFARDNDLTLNDVTIRLVNGTLTSSGDDARIKMQILGAAFAKDAARFSLGFSFNYDADGPKRQWDRRQFPCIPFHLNAYAII